MSDQKTIKLSKAIKIGEVEYKEIVLFEPNVKALESLSLHALQIGNTDQVVALLPKITEPKLTKQHINSMSIKDISKCAMVVTAFLIDPTEWSEEEEETEPMEA